MGEVTVSTYSVRTAVSQYPSPFGDRSDNQNMYAQCVRVEGGMNELRVACEVWSTEVCEVSLTKNLRENQPR
jgi:hypothetical protein